MNDVRVEQDAVVLTSFVIGSAPLPSAVSRTNNVFGSFPGGASFHGELSEFIVFTTSISDASNQQLLAYLRTKYGLIP